MQFNFEEQIKQKTDKELTEIFINAKDYNPDFVQLTEQELNKRNINVEQFKQVKEEIAQLDNELLIKGKQGSPLYILLCFVLAIFGGFIAIYAGFIYSQSKTSNNVGEKFYVYDEQTRQLGKIMIGLGIGAILFFMFKKVWTNY